MQKLNLSALKKQPGSTPVASVPSTQESTVSPEIQPTNTLPLTSTQNTISSSISLSSRPKVEITENEKKPTEEIIKVEQKEEILEIPVISVVKNEVKTTEIPLEEKKPVSVQQNLVASKEFFPNLGVEFNLLDDITGIKTVEKQDTAPAPVVLLTTESEEVVEVAKNLPGNLEAEQNMPVIQSEQNEKEIPVANASSIMSDSDIPGIVHEPIVVPVVTEVTTASTETTDAVSLLDSISITHSSPVSQPVVKTLEINSVEQVAKDLSAQRTGGLGVLFVNKKKVVFAASGLLTIILAGVAVLNFLPTDNIKSSVVENTPIETNSPPTPNVTPVVTSTGATATGSTLSGSVTTSTGSAQTATPEVTSTGTIAITGTGVVTTATGSTLENPQPQAFTGTRIINFRTPNSPRIQK